MVKPFVYSVTVVAALGGLCCAAEKPPRPNFLIIMADDLSPGHFGCYGDAAATTPHIDAMARAGVLFRTAWATPMCAPSRAELITGRYAHRTGVWHNQLSVRPAAGNLAANHLTFARVLRDAGYATAVAGKLMEIGGPLDDPAVGFQEYHVHWGNQRLPDGGTWDGPFETMGNAKGHTQPFTSRYWHPCIVRNGKHVPTTKADFGEELHAEFLIDFMKRHRSGPFLCYFSMNLPHGIATGKGDLPTTPLSGRPGTIDKGNLPECVAYIDVLVGRLVKALDDLGLRDNTLVIFTADNADGNDGKVRATEQGARVPLVVNCPGLVKARGATDELTDFSDVFPTLVDLAGARLPEGYALDGKSLAPFLRGTSDTHREWIYSYIGTARMIRDRRWLWEAVDPLGGFPGRFYDCGVNRGGRGYQNATESQKAEAAAARTRLRAALDKLPAIDPENPAGKAALEQYRLSPFPHKLENAPRRPPGKAVGAKVPKSKP
jgi:arylsulfatase A